MLFFGTVCTLRYGTGRYSTHVHITPEQCFELACASYGSRIWILIQHFWQCRSGSRTSNHTVLTVPVVSKIGYRYRTVPVRYLPTGNLFPITGTVPTYEYLHLQHLKKNQKQIYLIGRYRYLGRYSTHLPTYCAVPTVPGYLPTCSLAQIPVPYLRRKFLRRRAYENICKCESC